MSAVDATIWLTTSELAAKHGVSKQAVSKRAARLIEQHGLEVIRDARGHVSRINAVDYARLTATFGDSARQHTQQPAPVAPDTASRDPAATTLDTERIRALQLSSEQKRLELAESRALLVRHDKLGEALQRLAEDLVRASDLTQHADTLAAAAAKGLHALRIELKRLTIAHRTRLADTLQAAALAAPTVDPPLPETLFATEDA